MSFNVLMVIIPNQRIVVADLKAGRVPDAKYGKIAKLRSTHNNYLTLPVIFFMLSNHYPLAHSTDYSWLIAALVFLMGISIRHYFNSNHARKGSPRWTWGVTAALFLTIMALSLAPLFSHKSYEDDLSSADLSEQEMRLASAPHFEDVRDVVLGRCSMCHAQEPFYDGVRWPPKGVMLETDQQIIEQAHVIITQSALSHAMPPANVSYMEQEERALLLRWYNASFGDKKS